MAMSISIMSNALNSNGSADSVFQEKYKKIYSGGRISTYEIDKVKFISEVEENTVGLEDCLKKAAICVGAWESEWGRSNLARNYNNYFGIKEYGNASKIRTRTLEYINGKHVPSNENFRAYCSKKESIDHFISLKIVQESYNQAKGNPEQILRLLYEKGYARKGNIEWLKGVTGVLRTL